jgi:hypothetical protein
MGTLLSGIGLMLLAASAYLVIENIVWPNPSAGRSQSDNSEHHQAERSPGPHVGVSSVIIAEPSSETPLQLSIILADEMRSTGLLVLSGLPEAVSLSAGGAIGAGEWVVPLTELSNITLKVPARLSSDSLIYISLFVGWDGNRPLTAQARTRLVIVPKSGSERPVEVPQHVATAESDQNHSEAMAAASPGTSARYVPAGIPVADSEETSPKVHSIEQNELTRTKKIISRAEHHRGHDRVRVPSQTKRNRVVRPQGFQLFRKLKWW